MTSNGGDLWGFDFCDCLILDEASQMNLPEAMMAGLALSVQGQVIVVGDHRQMPPIIKHDWDIDPRRTFRAFKAYASLFDTMLPLVRLKKAHTLMLFQESFRLHRDIAELLHHEIYRHDGIHYHSKLTAVLDDVGAVEPESDSVNNNSLSNDFVRAVLCPQHPIIIVEHEEAASMLHNEFDRTLMRPVLEKLSLMQIAHFTRKSGPENAAENAVKDGLGVVVPHRAQRAALESDVPQLSLRDESEQIVWRTVDTVERFQGGERNAIVVGATESDPQYLLLSGAFLLDPRRLNVALSRARQKVILVASKSVFEIFSADEETFQHDLLWKNLLHRNCTQKLWDGEQDGIKVRVWGNVNRSTFIV